MEKEEIEYDDMIYFLNFNFLDRVQEYKLLKAIDETKCALHLDWIDKDEEICEISREAYDILWRVLWEDKTRVIQTAISYLYVIEDRFMREEIERVCPEVKFYGETDMVLYHDEFLEFVKKVALFRKDEEEDDDEEYEEDKYERQILED